MDITAKVFQDQGADVIEVEPDGDTPWARLLDAVWVGDWMSLVLAGTRRSGPRGHPVHRPLEEHALGSVMTKKVVVRDLGRMDYKPCWDLQEEVFPGHGEGQNRPTQRGPSTTDPGPEGEADLALPSPRCCGWSIRTS